MLIAEARVVTERSGLVQLYQQLNKVAQRNPQMQAHVEWSDDRGQISFGWGRCTLRTDPGVLTPCAPRPPTRNTCTSSNSASPTAWSRSADAIG